MNYTTFIPIAFCGAAIDEFFSRKSAAVHEYDITVFGDVLALALTDIEASMNLCWDAMQSGLWTEVQCDALHYLYYHELWYIADREHGLGWWKPWTMNTDENYSYAAIAEHIRQGDI